MKIPTRPFNEQIRKRALPSIQWLKERYQYEPDTGQIIGQKGRPIGAKSQNGYMNCSITYGSKKMLIRSHRLAFALMEGRWPHLIHHKDGKKTNNRWSNLEETTASENARLHRKKTPLTLAWSEQNKTWSFHHPNQPKASFALFCDAVRNLKRTEAWRQSDKRGAPPRLTRTPHPAGTASRKAYLSRLRTTSRPMPRSYRRTAPQGQWRQAELRLETKEAPSRAASRQAT